MTEDDELSGLRELRAALDHATEMLAALISCAASDELPPAALLEEAHRACDEVARWRARLRELVREEGNREMH